MFKRWISSENRFLEYLLVSGQFGSIIALGIITDFNSFPIVAYLFVIVGFILGAYAILVIKPGNFHVLPRPLKYSQLVLKGPYRYIRHPMYTSLLIIAAALTAGDFSLIKSGVSLLLILCLIIKLEYEETLLIKRFPDYETYRGSSKKLIPFVW